MRVQQEMLGAWDESRQTLNSILANVSAHRKLPLCNCMLTATLPAFSLPVGF